jgi:sterol 3beta-glucosyltransferase
LADVSPSKQLTVERLAKAIHQVVTDRSMRQRAAELGAKIQAEDGIANAVATIQTIERSVRSSKSNVKS